MQLVFQFDPLCFVSISLVEPDRNPSLQDTSGKLVQSQVNTEITYPEAILNDLSLVSGRTNYLGQILRLPSMFSAPDGPDVRRPSDMRMQLQAVALNEPPNDESLLERSWR